MNDQTLREQALTVHQSFIVQAPAGSGKTTLLVQRVLALLKTVNTPEEILAITFTKKAADEMRQRVIQALSTQSIVNRETIARWKLIENPHQLRIQTIDAFCASLVKQFPMRVFGGPKTDITETPLSLYEETVQTVLSFLEDDSSWALSLSKLLTHLDNDMNKLKNLLIKLIEKRDQWLAYLYHGDQVDVIKTQLERYLAIVVETHLQAIQASVSPEEQHTLHQLFSYTFSPEVAHHVAQWKMIAETLLTQTGAWRKQAITKPFIGNDALRTALHELRILPALSYTPVEWDILQALLLVLQLIAAQLKLTFQKHGKIDFIENTQIALESLTEDGIATEVALALHHQIKHILVDEFQDISYTQFKLIEKLTEGWMPDEGRTVFLVGDPMQSIYRFRNAEVSLFLQVKQQGIGTLPITPVTLTTNFRASQAIVAWHNTLFSNLFPKKIERQKEAIPYEMTQAATHDKGCTPVVYGMTDNTGKQQAQHIIRLIHAHLNQSPQSTIAILVRARQHLTDIIPALQAAHIPYQAIDIDPLIDKQIIIDMLSLTAILLCPADRLSWLAVLRAPWCGLTLTDLLILAECTSKTLPEQLQDATVLNQLSEAGKQHVERVFPIIQMAIRERGRQDLRSMVEATWRAIGGPMCCDQMTDRNNIAAYFELLEQLNRESNTLTIAHIRYHAERLFAKPNTEATVQLMTIHSAKGLEFDTVIIPHLEKRHAIDHYPLFVWMEQAINNKQRLLLLAAIHATGTEKEAIYNYILTQQKIKLDNEIDRLFYVAVTRAKKNLYLLFNMPNQPHNRPRIATGSFLKKLWPLLQDGMLPYHIHTQDLPIGHKTEKKDRLLRRLNAAWQPSLPVSTATITHHGIKGFQLSDNSHRLRGTFIHALFQQFSENGTAWWQQKNKYNKTTYIQMHLIRLGIAANSLSRHVTIIYDMIEQTLQDKMAQWIFYPHHNAQSELALSYLAEGDVKNIIIDRTFIEKDTRWIIDYKTTLLGSAVLKNKDQYHEQMKQYAIAMQQFDNHPIRLGLYFPHQLCFEEIQFA